MSWPQTPIALEPSTGGGTCIGEGALREADIIVSTTRAGVSTTIRIGTGSVISHAALYAGNGQVIEAIGEGVVRRPIEQSLAEDSLAVAYRSPNASPPIAARIVAYAAAQARAHAAYSVVGAVLSTDSVMCRIVGPRPASFYCSQLVLESYRRGGLPLSTAPSQCLTPQDLVVIAQHQLRYVGHLLGRATWFPVLSP